MQKTPVGQAAAEGLAVRALAWMAADPELIGGFLAAAGAGPSDLRARAAEPEFLGFVLDYLLSNEPALVAFAAAEGVRPDLPLRARAALPGGDLPNWT
ncbi:MAG TPA: DUF3572 domain-containing protein [Thermohalobaculum sp.]|nr:DUF3572 domain-containing protein [Thermohalobaculum sp.]